MIGSLEERKVFEEIQKKLFYMIPEKWESIHLYEIQLMFMRFHHFLI